MDNNDHIIIGANLTRLREALGITQHDLAIELDIAKRTLASIEAGNPNVRPGTKNKLLYFYNHTVDELKEEDLDITLGYRENIIEHHNGNPSYLRLLLKKPKLRYAIKHLLLKTDYLNDKREVNHVRLHFIEHYGWEYSGTSISNALKENEEILTKPSADKMNTCTYQKVSAVKD